MLDAKALSPSDTYVTLRYEFSNFSTCNDLRTAQDNAGL